MTIDDVDKLYDAFKADWQDILAPDSKEFFRAGFYQGHMKCPYCGKRVSDMPEHLSKTPACAISHAKKLKADLERLLPNPRGGPR